MESAKDSIKYLRPVYSKTQNGNELVDKTDGFSRLYEDADEYNDINNPNARRAIYETTEDRINQELALAPQAVDVEGSSVNTTGITFTFKAIETTNKELAKASKKWGAKGEKYIDGYCEIYEGVQTKVIAQQNKTTGTFLVSPEYSFLDISTAKDTDGAFTVSVSPADGATVPSTFDFNKVKVFGRYDSEDDFVGDYLGEVELKMSDYMFRPRPTSIGVTWSTLTEIVLDSSFNLNAEEYLVTSAAQAIKVSLDYKAIRLAYAAAKTNPDAYHVVFDAAYSTATNNNTGTKDSYLANSMTFLSAVSTVGDSIYNDINMLVSRFLKKHNYPNCWEISINFREYQQLKLDKLNYKNYTSSFYNNKKRPPFFMRSFLF